MKLVLVTLLIIYAAPASAKSLWIAQSTTFELRSALKAGANTVIIPTAGTEQNGPYLPIGKHHEVVSYNAQQIAEKLGQTFIAPVLDYTPEGRIQPPEGHMRFAGTISLREETFERVLEDAARSLKQHGFTRICFLGDSGPNQAPQARVAERLNKEWEGQDARVLSVDAYYNEGQGSANAWLQSMGEKMEAIGTHAGISDTSQMMAIKPITVRPLPSAAPAQDSGVVGDPRHATAAYGKHILDARVNAAVTQISAWR